VIPIPANVVVLNGLRAGSVPSLRRRGFEGLHTCFDEVGWRIINGDDVGEFRLVDLPPYLGA
jgi:hypothetical protein